MVGVLAGQNWGSGGLRTRGFVWASKREVENGHTETRSYFGDFCLAKVRGVVREGLVYNRAWFGWFWWFWWVVKGFSTICGCRQEVGYMYRQQEIYITQRL